MDARAARAIVEALAEGVDPLTGEVLAEGTPLQSGEVVRALYAALDALDERIRRGAGGGERAHAGGRWTPDEEERLEAMFEAGRSVTELGREFGRTRVAIAARLVRLGKAPNRQWAMRANGAGRGRGVGMGPGLGQRVGG